MTKNPVPLRLRVTQLSPGFKLYATFLNIEKCFETVRFGLGLVAVIFQFTNIQYCRDNKMFDLNNLMNLSNILLFLTAS